jgi:uncharacterized membrane protein HdeD (DUF308 family)
MDRESFKHRPVSVTIIAILAIILGILAIFGGLVPLAFAAVLPEFSVYFVVIGSILIAIGIAYLVVSYGLMKGRGWAWSVTIIISYIGIVFSIVAIVSGNFASIPQLIISIIIVFFLYRPQSKAFFGKRPNAYI